MTAVLVGSGPSHGVLNFLTPTARSATPPTWATSAPTASPTGPTTASWTATWPPSTSTSAPASEHPHQSDRRAGRDRGGAGQHQQPQSVRLGRPQRRHPGPQLRSGGVHGVATVGDDDFQTGPVTDGWSSLVPHGQHHHGPDRPGPVQRHAQHQLSGRRPGAHHPARAPAGARRRHLPQPGAQQQSHRRRQHRHQPRNRLRRRLDPAAPRHRRQQRPRRRRQRHHLQSVRGQRPARQHGGRRLRLHGAVAGRRQRTDQRLQRHRAVHLQRWAGPLARAGDLDRRRGRLQRHPQDGRQSDHHGHRSQWHQRRQQCGGGERGGHASFAGDGAEPWRLSGTPFDITVAAVDAV